MPHSGLTVAYIKSHIIFSHQAVLLHSVFKTVHWKIQELFYIGYNLIPDIIRMHLAQLQHQPV